jgi:hypothetical protein
MTIYLKDPETERAKEWKKKVSKEDALRAEKKEKIEIACDLHYTDYTLQKIVDAPNEHEITVAMQTNRESLMEADLESKRLIKIKKSA